MPYADSPPTTDVTVKPGKKGNDALTATTVHVDVTGRPDISGEYRLINGGLDRRVYAHPDNTAVIKIRKPLDRSSVRNRVTQAQQRNEINVGIWRYHNPDHEAASLLPAVYAYTPDRSAVVCEYIDGESGTAHAGDEIEDRLYDYGFHGYDGLMDLHASNVMEDYGRFCLRTIQPARPSWLGH